MSRPPPGLAERVASAAAWNTLLFPARMIVGLVANVLLFNFLAPAEYGVLALLTGLAATIGVYADPGIERSLPRFIPEVEQRAGRAGVARFMVRIVAIKIAIVLVCIALLALFSSPLVAYVASNERQQIATLAEQAEALRATGADAAAVAVADAALERQQQLVAQIEQRGLLFLAAVATLVFFGALYDVAMQFLTAYFKQRAWNIVTIVVTLIQPLLIIALLLLGWGLSGVLLGMVITPVVAVLLAGRQSLMAARELPLATADAVPDPGLAGRFARFAGVSYFIQVTTWFYDVQFLTFVLYGLGMPLEAVALLAFAYKFAKDYLGYAYIPFSGVVTPLLARIKGRDDAAALQEAYGGLTRIFALILIPAGVGLALLASRLLDLLYPQYTEAIVLIYLLIGFTFLESLISVPHNVLMVYERYRPVIIARILALVSVPLLLLLVPGFGLIGAALAVGLARILSRLVGLGYVRRVMGLHLPWRFLVRVSGAAAIFAIPLLLLLPYWPLPATAGGVAGKAPAALSLLGLG
ncbi:MAG TPA: polysaccharide biosynthesis C-terminal domain-containing protein [Roseiflexaceae bacterium]|nr:polysaccharide biosynthesis C-terminal domain-containing protein [Roseiflexaceae bacterium]